VHQGRRDRAERTERRRREKGDQSRPQNGQAVGLVARNARQDAGIDLGDPAAEGRRSSAISKSPKAMLRYFIAARRAERTSFIRAS